MLAGDDEVLFSRRNPHRAAHAVSMAPMRIPGFSMTFIAPARWIGRVGAIRALARVQRAASGTGKADKSECPRSSRALHGTR